MQVQGLLFPLHGLTGTTLSLDLQLEIRLLQYLSKKFATTHRISIERLVSGNGLANVSPLYFCDRLNLWLTMPPIICLCTACILSFL